MLDDEAVGSRHMGMQPLDAELGIGLDAAKVGYRHLVRIICVERCEKPDVLEWHLFQAKLDGSDRSLCVDAVDANQSHVGFK